MTWARDGDAHEGNLGHGALRKGLEHRRVLLDLDGGLVDDGGTLGVEVDARHEREEDERDKVGVGHDARHRARVDGLEDVEDLSSSSSSTSVSREQRREEERRGQRKEWTHLVRVGVLAHEDLDLLGHLVADRRCLALGVPVRDGRRAIRAQGRHDLGALVRGEEGVELGKARLAERRQDRLERLLDGDERLKEADEERLRDACSLSGKAQAAAREGGQLVASKWGGSTKEKGEVASPFLTFQSVLTAPTTLAGTRSLWTKRAVAAARRSCSTGANLPA